ncbi:MAG: flippase-like domain-containing protein [Oscillatoria sp. SIO1A7]|nr:flippase-like domain-containing protein [Oscillatoria sp. SIO1A7]
MKKIFSLIVSLTILAVIYAKIDLRELIRVFQNCDLTWMAIALGMLVPLVMITAWRLQQLVPAKESLSILKFGEANRLILAASVLNMILPSKMGDIAKAYFMRDKGHLSGSLALSLVVFEKACDLLSLLLWCAFGLLLYPAKNFLFWVMTAGVGAGLLVGILLLSSRRFASLFFNAASRFAPKKVKLKIDKLRLSWGEMHEYFWSDFSLVAKIALTSIFLWLCHLLQILFFIFALRATVPFLAHLALSPLAILAGLMPLTFAGVGTRDEALILFYQPYFDAATGAALGLLCTARYLLPALAGLPFFREYLAAIQTEDRV